MLWHQARSRSLTPSAAVPAVTCPPAAVCAASDALARCPAAPFPSFPSSSSCSPLDWLRTSSRHGTKQTRRSSAIKGAPQLQAALAPTPSLLPRCEAALHPLLPPVCAPARPAPPPLTQSRQPSWSCVTAVHGRCLHLAPSQLVLACSGVGKPADRADSCARRSLALTPPPTRCCT